MKYTHSAGGVVLNKEGKVLIVSQRGKSWSLPKGHLHKNEDHLTAAIREIHEETGISELTLIKEMGAYTRYKLDKINHDDHKELKTITLFLFTTEQMTLTPLDKKHPEALWVHPTEITDMLSHPKDKEFYASNLHVIEAHIANHYSPINS
jgi:8-oxo-dGTP pyrophosphatase MutT (NUDIX family)